MFSIEWTRLCVVVPLISPPVKPFKVVPKNLLHFNGWHLSIIDAIIGHPGCKAKEEDLPLHICVGPLCCSVSPSKAHTKARLLWHLEGTQLVSRIVLRVHLCQLLFFSFRCPYEVVILASLTVCWQLSPNGPLNCFCFIR